MAAGHPPPSTPPLFFENQLSSHAKKFITQRKAEDIDFAGKDVVDWGRTTATLNNRHSTTATAPEH